MLLQEMSLSLHAQSGRAIVGCLVLTALFYPVALVVYRLYLHPLRRYPGPLLARATNLYAMYHAWKGDKHLDIYRLHGIYGDLVRIQPNLISANTSSAIKEIYGAGHNVQKGHLYKAAMANNGGVNTFNSIDRTVHSHKRRVLAPCFSEQALKHNEDSILPLIRSFLDVVSGEGGQAPWEGDMSLWSTYLVFDIMGKLSFGKDFGMLRGPETHGVPKLIEANTHYILLAGTSPFVFKWGLDRVFGSSLSANSEKLMGFVRAQVEERKAKRFEDTAFLDHLIEAKDKDGRPSYPNESQLAAEARSLVVAGSDTTATQLAANFFYLSSDPRAQRALAHEIRSAFANADAIHPGPALDACTYLKAFVEETLRMSPSVPGILPREVLPGGITVAGHAFPAGVELTVPIYALHHNAAYYSEPHRHWPERWLPEVVGKEAVERCWSAFTPFSYGSRACVGRRLAYVELWVTIARVVWMFDLEYCGGGREEAFGRNVVEYRLLDHLTAARTGPVVRFVKRLE